MAEKLGIGREFVLKFVGKEKLTSVDFVDTFRYFDKDNNGYIENEELDDFLVELFRKVNIGVKGQVATSCTPDLQKLKQDILEHADLNRDGKIEISELAVILPKDENFLLKFKTKQAKMRLISSVEFMEIWNYYDQDGNGFLDEKEVRGFVFDLLTKINNAVKTPKEIQEDVDDLVQAIKIECRRRGHRHVELHYMKRLLPVEKNFMEKLPRLEEFGKDEVNEVFSYYDKNGNGELDGDELLAFLKDILERKINKREKKGPAKANKREKKEKYEATMAHVQMFRDHVMTSLDPNSNGTISKTELMDYIHDLRRKKTENATKLPQTD